MAVDGVAPRAKMNQQRGRRFRSAKEAEDNIRRAIEKGQVLPKEERFDSNCITPGTGFMTRLQEQLKYFVNEKITNDPAWRGLRVYLSGHQTPGEGEHKIMEFIRTERSQPGYDPNTRHCLYGLDADLSTLSFPYDLERVIDDWILMGFLVGNDFIPHLPHMHIKQGHCQWMTCAVTVSPLTDFESITFETPGEGEHKIMEFIRTERSQPGYDPNTRHCLYGLDADLGCHNREKSLFQLTNNLSTRSGTRFLGHTCYLHDGGVLNLERFEKYLTALSKLDREKFDEVFVDMKWFEAKTKHGFDKKPGKSRKKGKKTRDEETNPFAALESLSGKLDEAKLDDDDELSPELAKLAAALDDDEEESKETSEEDVFEIEFAMYKKQYYREKFEIENIRSDQLSTFVWEYIRGIQWILHYYFNGVQSWGWYYPYHYAPFLSDLTDFSHYQLDFDMGKPFLPFEQLLANLMIMEESPIIEYYPLNFKTDLNGKQQEWEAVVLIPFIDQKMLLDAMTPLYPRLTKEEKQRNTHGPFVVYSFDNEVSFAYPSPLPGAFPDISLCQAK
ncbi:5'-3' exoribonuclease 2 [Exaiptasia diaphana]|nr:5'-3' exoribonuclease 2 [Exaiptasia diaphana]